MIYRKIFSDFKYVVLGGQEGAAPREEKIIAEKGEGRRGEGN